MHILYIFYLLNSRQRCCICRIISVRYCCYVFSGVFRVARCVSCIQKERIVRIADATCKFNNHVVKRGGKRGGDGGYR